MGEVGLPNKHTNDADSPSPRPTAQPTTQEERDAEESRKQVDVAKVRDHETEMNQLGANVKGEGGIVTE